MEVTALFKACVKTVKTRNKALGLLDVNAVDNSSNKHSQSSDILRKHSRSPQDRQFSIRTKEVVSNISHLKKFLLEHRKDYIDVRHLTCEIGGMTDAERDNIDQDAEKYMRLCSDIITKLKKEFYSNTSKDDCSVASHQNAVIAVLENYLKDVCKLYSEQKAIRVKRSVDMQKMSRLEPELKSTANSKEDSPTDDKEPPKEDSDKPYRRTRTFSYDQFEEAEMSPEEIQMFEQENKDLHNELNSLVDEVRQVEGKVVEISRLQQIFSEKILQQDKDMQRISETAVGTTENIKEANDQIREAMKRNTGFRVWILFFLLVLSFSLLFLDWYNP